MIDIPDLTKQHHDVGGRWLCRQVVVSAGGCCVPVRIQAKFGLLLQRNFTFILSSSSLTVITQNIVSELEYLDKTLVWV